MSECITCEMKRDIHHVREAWIEMAVAGCVAADDLVLQQIVDDRQIVRSQIPQAIHVLLKQSEIDPHRVEIADVAEFAPLRELLDHLDSASEQESMIDHQYAFGLVRDGRQF